MSFNDDLKNRTKAFAVEIIKLYASLPKTDEMRVIGKQLLRSSTSVAANFRAYARGRSDKERFAKLSITVEEMDESLFWLEIFEESELLHKDRIITYKNEALELLKILSSFRKTLKNRL